MRIAGIVRCAKGAIRARHAVGDDQTGRTESLSDASLTLVARLNQKAPEAAALFHQLYRNALIRFCFGYLGQVEEAEDAVQEICVKVLDASSIPEHFRPWLYKIARNHCLKSLRERSRKYRELVRPSQIPEAITGHLTRMVKNEMRERLSDVFQQLSEEHREVLRLRYVEDLSRAEIADVLDLPESVVKSRLFEGLQRLREEADRFGEA
jgi:RNA polymerase sigma-70 factor (ECF subfamily)